MAQPPRLVEPPIADPVLIADPAAGQMHSQAWTEYHQSVADNIVALRSKKGVIDGSDANAGDVGEYLEAVSGTVGLSGGVSTDVVPLALPAGDWDVEGNVAITPSGATSYAMAGVGVGAVSFGAVVTRVAGATPPTQFRLSTGGALRVSTATAVTVHLVAECGFSSGSVSASGRMWARRTR